jgi:hypothetical protein
MSLLKPVGTKAVPNVKHSNQTVRWGTPDTPGHDYVGMSRKVLGGKIELDPMSEEVFNQRVKAERFFTKEQDCFKQSWACETLFINPAGGLVVQAWQKLISGYTNLDIGCAIWIGFSVEQLCQLADFVDHPMDFSWLLPRKRIPFIRHDGFIGAPGHTNYVVGLGVDHNLFESVFGSKGKVGCGSMAIYAT